MTRASKRQLVRRQRRSRKIEYLRRRLEATTSLQQRRQLIEKLHRISPRAPVPER